MRLVVLTVNDGGFVITLTLLQGMPFMPPLVLVLELNDLTIPDRDIHACSGSLENTRKKRKIHISLLHRSHIAYNLCHGIKAADVSLYLFVRDCLSFLKRKLHSPHLRNV